jgi:hypothetical protein
MNNSEQSLAAEAKVGLKKAEGGNTELHIEANHLAPAQRVRNDAEEYVVWVEPLNGSGPPQNVGALPVDKDLEAELKTITPLHTFQVYVTPEPSGDVAHPSGPKVLAAVVR